MDRFDIGAHGLARPRLDFDDHAVDTDMAAPGGFGSLQNVGAASHVDTCLFVEVEAPPLHQDRHAGHDMRRYPDRSHDFAPSAAHENRIAILDAARLGAKRVHYELVREQYTNYYGLIPKDNGTESCRER